MSTTARPVRLRRFAGAGIAALLFLTVYAVTNLTAAGQAVENGLLGRWTQDQTLAYLLYHDVPIPPLKFEAPVLVGGVLLAALVAGARRRWRDLVTVVIAVPLSVLASQLFKSEVGRPRLTDSADVDPSYPSGHFLVAAALTLALLTVVPRSWLRWCAPVLLAWTAVVASAVQAFGWHRTSDEVGSATLAAAVFLLVRGAVSGSGERVQFRVRTVLPAAAGIALLAALAAVTPEPWSVPIIAASSVVSTAIVALTALLGLRAGDPPAPSTSSTGAPGRIGAASGPVQRSPGTLA